MKKQLFLIGIIILIVAGILLALNLATIKPNEIKNGFNRIIINNLITTEKEISIPENVITRIAGISGDRLFLQSSNPNIIYYTGDFNKIDMITFQFPDIPKLKSSFAVVPKYPFIYILAGNARKIVKNNFVTRENQVISVQSPGPLSYPISINDNEWTLRCTDTISRNAYFIKINLTNGEIIKKDNFSERLGDAGFIHDGLLLYDQKNKFQVYREYYSNRITIFNEQLELKNYYHTIDTFFSPTMKIRRTLFSVTNSEPPKMINGVGSLANGILYVRSYLQADNEKNFENRIAIDRYDISTGAYIGSFYLPYSKSDRLVDFKIHDDLIYILFKDKIVRTKINVRLK